MSAKTYALETRTDKPTSEARTEPATEARTTKSGGSEARTGKAATESGTTKPATEARTAKAATESATPEPAAHSSAGKAASAPSEPAPAATKSTAPLRVGRCGGHHRPDEANGGQNDHRFAHHGNYSSPANATALLWVAHKISRLEERKFGGGFDLMDDAEIA